MRGGARRRGGAVWLALAVRLPAPVQAPLTFAIPLVALLAAADDAARWCTRWYVHVAFVPVADLARAPMVRGRFVHRVAGLPGDTLAMRAW